jgi:hypothetical protein
LTKSSARPGATTRSRWRSTNEVHHSHSGPALWSDLFWLPCSAFKITKKCVCVFMSILSSFAFLISYFSFTPFLLLLLLFS